MRASLRRKAILKEECMHCVSINWILHNQ